MARLHDEAASAAAAEQRAVAAEAELSEARQQAAAAATELQAMEEAFTELQKKVGICHCSALGLMHLGCFKQDIVVDCGWKVRLLKTSCRP